MEGNASPDALKTPTPQQLRNILGFLPQIEHPAEPFYKCDPETSVFDPYIYSPVVDRLISALYGSRMVQPFDWGAWQDQARAFMADPARVGDAHLETIVRLFTTILRKDRFCSGTIAAFLDDGFILALLKRLDTISKTES